jgi:hypothetical protein
MLEGVVDELITESPQIPAFNNAPTLPRHAFSAYPRTMTSIPEPPRHTEAAPIEHDKGLLTDTGLHRVEAAYADVMRISTLLGGVPAAIGATAADALWVSSLGVPVGLLSLAAWLLLAICAIVLPSRRYSRIGYAISDTELRVARGLFFRVDTMVPFVRVQHIDMEQGPIERQYGLSSLVVHTSGAHNSTVTVPGLKTEVATTMRDAIRQHILSDFA